MRFGLRMLLVTLLCGVTVAGGGATVGVAEAAAATPKACVLLTAPEIYAALGTEPILPPKTDSGDQCSYSAEGMFNFLDVSLEPLVLADRFASNAQGAGATVAVAGVGDQAFRNTSGSDLFVRSGKEVLRITVFSPNPSPTATAMLANNALARLNRTGGSSTSSSSSNGWSLVFSGAVKGGAKGGTASCSPSTSLTVTKLTRFKVGSSKSTLTIIVQIASPPSGGGTMSLSPTPRAHTVAITLSGATGGVYRSTKDGSFTANADGTGTLDAPLVQGTGSKTTTVTGSVGCSGRPAI